jgi:hypothetical protein
MASRSFKWAIVLCRFSDKPNETRSRDYYEDLFTQNGAGGVCDYWRAVTENNVDLTESRVFGWFQMNHASTELNGLVFPGQRGTLVQWGRDAAAANAVNLATFDTYWSSTISASTMEPPGMGSSSRIRIRTCANSGSSAMKWVTVMGCRIPSPPLPILNTATAGDLMSFATTTYQFNIAFRGSTGAATVGLNARNLEALNAVPARRLWNPPAPDFSVQVILQPLNQQVLGNRGFLIAKVLSNSTMPGRTNGSSYTVEFRRRAGWDRSIPRDAVLVHEVRSNGNSYLRVMGLNLVGGEEFVTPDPKVFIRVVNTDTALDTATLRLWDLPNGSLRKRIRSRRCTSSRTAPSAG